MPTAGDIIRVAARQRFDATDDIVNVLHFAIEGVPTPNTDASVMQDIAELISEAYALIASKITTRVVAVDLTFYNIDTDSPMGQRTWDPAYTGGTGSGESMPSHDSCLVLLQTAVKRTQGRIYLPPFTEAQQSGGEWVTGVYTAVDAFLSVLIGPWSGGTFTGEYMYGVHKRSSGATAFPNSGRISTLVAVQTRRKLGRGS